MAEQDNGSKHYIQLVVLIGMAGTLEFICLDEWGLARLVGFVCGAGCTLISAVML